MGDRGGEGRVYGNLGNAFQKLGDYRQSIEYSLKRLDIAKEMADIKGGEEAAYNSLGEFETGKHYHNLKLEIIKKTGDRTGEGMAYGSLGCDYGHLGDFRKKSDITK